MPSAARIEALPRAMADIVPLAEYGQPYPAWPMPVQRFVRDLAATLTLTILIVDDHPSFRATARMLLSTEGFDVVGAVADGESAIAEVDRLDPDVVLLDVGLPDIDGFEVAERLRADGARSAVVFTSSRDGADFGSLIATGHARGFIAKAELSGDAIRALVQ